MLSTLNNLVIRIGVKAFVAVVVFYVVYEIVLNTTNNPYLAIIAFAVVLAFVDDAISARINVGIPRR